MRVTSANLIGLEIGIGQRLVDGADALEQSLIEEDGVGRCSQLRLPLALERLIRGVGDVLARDAEHAIDAIEHAAGSLHRRDRVFEGRRVGCRDDGVDLAALFGERFLERAGKQLGRHAIPRRNSAVGSRPGRRQWILRHFGECYRDSSDWA